MDAPVASLLLGLIGAALGGSLVLIVTLLTLKKHTTDRSNPPQPQPQKSDECKHALSSVKKLAEQLESPLDVDTIAERLESIITSTLSNLPSHSSNSSDEIRAALTELIQKIEASDSTDSANSAPSLDEIKSVIPEPVDISSIMDKLNAIQEKGSDNSDFKGLSSALNELTEKSLSAFNAVNDAIADITQRLAAHEQVINSIPSQIENIFVSSLDAKLENVIKDAVSDQSGEEKVEAASVREGDDAQVSDKLITADDKVPDDSIDISTIRKEIKERDPLVFLVDDSRTIRIVNGKLFKEYDIKYEEAIDGADAIEKINNGIRPDIVLLDVEMPNIDGFGVAAHLRDNEHTKNIPVIMVTSKDKEQFRSQVDEYQVYDMIDKDFEKESLVRMIHMLTS